MSDGMMKRKKDLLAEGVLSHVGADLDTDLVKKFRDVCEAEGYLQNRVFELALRKFVTMEPLGREEFYHDRASLMKGFDEQVRAALQRIQAHPRESKDGRPAQGR